MLTVTTERLVEELNNLKVLCIEEALKNGIDGVDERGFKAMQSTLKVISLSNQMMIEQANMMDDMNKKLDKLLERKTERS